MLADEMGLGKTVQSISFLTTLYEKKTRGPFLVVAPVSTLRNWEREFEKWAPHINVIKYAGTPDARKIIKEHEFFFSDKSASAKDAPLKFSVLLTSYNLILQDESVLKKFNWEVLIVDEAQRLKNKSSKLFQAFFNYKINFKLLLTGTPLQNSLQELFVLLHFLTPETFKSVDEFKQQFGDPLTREQQINKLHKLLAPHMLRRVKADVLGNLPGKAEFIVRVEMSELQLEYYRAILTKNYKILNGTTNGKSTRFSLSNIMMELQKCCNHPFLFLGAEPQNTASEAQVYIPFPPLFFQFNYFSLSLFPLLLLLNESPILHFFTFILSLIHSFCPLSD